MSQEQLKLLRLFVPGVMLYILLIPPILDLTTLEERWSTNLLRYSIPALIFGVIYDIVDARRLAWGGSVRQVNANIKDKLLEPCCEDDEISAATEKLREGRVLLNVFYSLVDNDPSLQEKAKRVRFNGILWSSVADLETVGVMGTIVYLVGYAVTGLRFELAMTIGLALISLVAHFVFVPRYTGRQIRLSNEQLEFIVQKDRAGLCKQIKGAALGR